MAYASAGLQKVSSGIGSGGTTMWIYTHASDAIATVAGASYFSDAIAQGMGLGDVLFYVRTSTGIGYPCTVTAVSATAATVTAMALS
jgi:hypothetical protein